MWIFDSVMCSFGFVFVSFVNSVCVLLWLIMWLLVRIIVNLLENVVSSVLSVVGVVLMLDS